MGGGLFVKGIAISLTEINAKIITVNGVQPESFADWVKALRADKRWTQTELGDHVGLTQSDISELETGTKPKPDQLFKFAFAFKLSLDYVAAKAGLMPGKEGIDAYIEEIRSLLSRMSPEKWDAALLNMESFVEVVAKEEARARAQSGKGKPRR